MRVHNTDFDGYNFIDNHANHDHNPHHLNDANFDSHNLRDLLPDYDDHSNNNPVRCCCRGRIGLRSIFLKFLWRSSVRAKCKLAEQSLGGFWEINQG